MFRLLSILCDLWQVNLFKMAKYWDSFLSHYMHELVKTHWDKQYVDMAKDTI